MANYSQSARKGSSMEDFLNRKDDSEGGGGKFFSLNFKEKSEYRIWIHPKTGWDTIWRSVLHTTDGKKNKIFRWNIMETHKICNKIRFKEEDGSFQHSPKQDPVLLLMQWVNMKIVAGTIDFTDEIMKFEPEEGDEKIIHAGGFTGMFQSQKLEKEQRAEMRKIGVRQDNAYQEDARPSEELVLIIVDNENPAEGPQICTLKRGPAKALVAAIEALKKKYSKNPSKANILENPVCFSIEKDDSNDGPPKYTVAETDDELTDVIQEAFDTDPPSTDRIFEDSNVVALRRVFETYWVHEETPDWDDIFAAAEKAVEGTPAGEEPEQRSFSDKKKSSKKVEEDEDEEEDADFDFGANKKASKKDEDEVPEKKSSTKAKAFTPEPEVEEVEGATCDKCGEIIPDEAFTDDGATCPHCKAEYVKNAEGEFELVNAKKVEESVKPSKPQIKASRRPRD